MLHGFAPIIDTHSRILVLGSAPSVQSLERAEYYANPRNRFWPIIAALATREGFSSYSDKLASLATLELALWDVLSACERHGSLDSTISEPQPNDIGSLLAAHPAIRRVCLNGRTAAAMFHRFCRNMPPTIEVISLPSTSPANARWQFIAIYNCWHTALCAPHSPL